MVRLDPHRPSVSRHRIEQPPSGGHLRLRPGGANRRLVDTELQQPGGRQPAGRSLEVHLAPARLVVDDPHPPISREVYPVHPASHADRSSRREADGHGAALVLAEAVFDRLGHPALFSPDGIVEVQDRQEACLQLVDAQLG